MPEIWTIGEILVEIMRPEPGISLGVPGQFLGPFPSGAPAIFIDTAARLGRTAGIIGGAADDAFGTCLVNRLAKDGVDVSRINHDSSGATAVAFVTYEEDGSRSFIYHIDGTPAVRVDGNAFLDHEVKFFHVMGCSLMANEGLRLRIVDSVREARNLGARISFDPNLRVELLGSRSLIEVIGPILDSTSVLLPSESELCLLGGKENVPDAAQQLFSSYPIEIIAAKRGKQGAAIYTRTQVIDISPFRVEEIDPTGAGDCFDAAFLVGLLEGMSLEECGRFAAAAGALNAAAFGPMEGNLSRETVDRLIEEGSQ